MTQIVRLGFTISIFSYVVLHLLAFFMNKAWMLHAMSFSGLIALLFALIYLKPKNGLVPYFLTTAALILGYFTLGEAMWVQLWEGLRQMRGIILLLIFVPIIGWVLREEDYIEALIGFAKDLLRTSKRFYVGIMLVTQIIAYFLLFAAIPMVFQFVQVLLGDKKNEDWEHYKGTALLRGFGLCTLFVISIPSLAYIIDLTGAPLGFTLMQGLFISFCGILLSIVFIRVHEKVSGLDYSAGIQEELDRKISSENSQRYKRLAYEFGLLFITLFGPILVLNSLVDWGLLMAISTGVFFWAIIYFMMKKKWAIFVNYIRLYVQEGMLPKTQEMGLLLAAGMMISIVNASGVGILIIDSLIYFSDQYTFIHILGVLPIMVIFLGFLGLGPLTVLVLVGGILQGAPLPYPPELIVLSLTLGSAITVFLSPVILPLIVLSQANGLSGWRNGIKFNIGFAAVFYAMVLIYMMIMLWLR